MEVLPTQRQYANRPPQRLSLPLLVLGWSCPFFAANIQLHCSNLPACLRTTCEGAAQVAAGAAKATPSPRAPLPPPLVHFTHTSLHHTSRPLHTHITQSTALYRCGPHRPIYTVLPSRRPPSHLNSITQSRPIYTVLPILSPKILDFSPPAVSQHTEQQSPRIRKSQSITAQSPLARTPGHTLLRTRNAS